VHRRERLAVGAAPGILEREDLLDLVVVDRDATERPVPDFRAAAPAVVLYLSEQSALLCRVF
jgi:hypothetical protein